VNDYLLATAGDEYARYYDLLIEMAELKREAAQLARIRQVLEERAPWTAECDTTAGRVEALAIAYELRSAA
jgi:hypothetical protein